MYKLPSGFGQEWTNKQQWQGKQNKKQSGQQFLSPEQYLKQKARTLEIGKCYITDAVSGTAVAVED